MILLKLTTVHRDHGHVPPHLVRRDLFFQTENFESIENTPHEEMPGNTHLRSTSGGAWDLEKSSDEEQKGVIQERNQYIKSNEKYIQILKK